MRSFLRFSLIVLLLLGADFMGNAPRSTAALQAPANATQSAAPPPTATPQAVATAAVPTDPRALYDALNALRPDGARVYNVKDLTLRRDVVSFTFTRGKIAFLEPLGGRVTGAVFSGRGHVIATPHERGERRSLAQFIGSADPRSTVFRRVHSLFRRHRRRTAAPTRARRRRTQQRSGFHRALESVAAGLAPDSLAAHHGGLARGRTHSLFLHFAGNGLRPGPVEVSWITAAKSKSPSDSRASPTASASYDMWASFRTENSPAEKTEAFLPLDYRVDSTIAEDLSLQGKTTLHLRAGRTGERVVAVELSRHLTVDEIQGEDGQPLPYFQNDELSRRDAARRGNDFILAVLPAGKPAGADFHLQISYHGSVIADAGNGAYFVGERGAWYAHIGGEHFTPFDLTFHWPKRLTLVATGDRIRSARGRRNKIRPLAFGNAHSPPPAST